MEVPAVERLQDRFRAAHTQPLGISVDSIFSHANWAQSLGGISFPLLADFHPKGQVAASYGLYLEDQGITDRATVIIDANGIVRHASSVTPSGQRDIDQLAALCEKLDGEHGQRLLPFPTPPGLEPAELYIKSSCGFSRAVMLALDNLQLRDKVALRNVSEDPAALAELKRLTGKMQAPCLVEGGKPLLESAEIIKHLLGASTDIPPRSSSAEKEAASG